MFSFIFIAQDEPSLVAATDLPSRQTGGVIKGAGKMDAGFTRHDVSVSLSTSSSNKASQTALRPRS